MKYKYLLFDLDGTITESKEGIIKSVQYALKKLGIETCNQNDLEKFIGPPLLESFMNFYFFDEEKANLAVRYYREYFQEKGIFENKVYKGVPELLSKLKEHGCIICLATSKPEIFSRRILDYFDLTKYFEIIKGSNLDGSFNDKKDIIAFILNELNITDKNQAVMIGDRRHDISGANENGIDSIGVLYGYGEHKELLREGATAITADINTLYYYLLRAV